MNRRIAATAVAALALAVVPATTASAYEAIDFSSTLSATSFSAGSPFNYVVDGPLYNDKITASVTSTSVVTSAISIAGTSSLAKATDAAGDATFNITLAAAGSYTITAVDAEGTVINTQTIAVGSAATSTGAASGAATLPVTGSSPLPLTIVPVRSPQPASERSSSRSVAGQP